MTHRHKARRLAMQALCCLDAQGPDGMDLASGFIRESRDNLAIQDDAQAMLAGTWEAREQVDPMLAQHSRRWDVHRMPVVDRNILRLAVWELITETAPPPVVINEAVRLAREFSTAESPRFINGILDAIARDMGGPTDEAEPPAQP